MAHDIAVTETGQHMTAWAGSTPWHGLGTNVSGLMTSHDALVKAHLNWQVVKKPLFYSELSNHEYFSIDHAKPVPNTFGVFRESDDGLIPLTRNGKSVGKVWTALQNADAFSFMDEILQTQEATIEVAGALGNGEKVWVLAKMPETILINGQDPIEQYFLITNNHDGTGAVKFLPTPIRVVCQNTLSLALSNATTVMSKRHTSKLGNAVDEARESLGIMNQDFITWGEKAESLLAVEMELDDMKEYFVDTLGLKREENGEISDDTRTRNKLNKVVSLLATQKNLIGDMEGTAWAAYNAATEYFDHHATTLRNGEKSIKATESAIFGPFARRKQKAWDLAMEMTV